MGLIGTVGLVLHPRRDCSGPMEAVLEWAHGHGAEVLGLTDEIARIGDGARAVPEDRLADRADLLVSLGGDGTMLRALRLMAGRAAPVLGVNLGRLGFLAEIDVPELPEALSAIDGRRFTVETRAAVRATFPGGTTTAFNDVVLVRIPGRGGSAVVELQVDGHRFLRYASDAVVVATPTGSTAYSFSAGGPIVSPRAEGLLVIPAAAHSAFNRALFLAGDERLGMQVLPSSGELAIEADGRVLGHVSPGDRVEVELVPGAAHVVRFGRTSFYERAQRRLGLAGSTEAD